MRRPGIEPGTFHLPGGCSTTKLPTPLYFPCSPEHVLLNYRHPCMRCDASSDDRATALPVIYLVLISTYQVSSAWLECRALQRKKVKVWCADRGLNPGPFTCRANALTTELPTPLYFLCNPERMLLNYRHPCMRCDASSDDRATALPVIYLIVLISTYQVSSACTIYKNERK